MDPACWLWKKGSRLSKPSAWGNFLAFPTWSTRPMFWVQSKINFLLGPQMPLLATVKRQKLAWFGHVTCYDSLSKTILQGTLQGGQCHGQQRKCWMDNIKEWTSLPNARTAHEGLLQKRLEEDPCWIVPHVPPDDPIIQGTELNLVFGVKGKVTAFHTLVVMEC